MPGMKACDAGLFEMVCNATAIRKASRRITQFYDSTLEPCGLRSTQLAILSQLVGAAGPLTIGDLAKILVIDRSALGHNVRPLVRDGFVRLETSSEDRRRSAMTATRLGRAKWREAQKLWQDAQSRFEAQVGSAKAARLRKTLASIAHLDDLTSTPDA